MRKKIIEQFVEAINHQQVLDIIALMAEDFQLIDTYGNLEDKKDMASGWSGYFAWFPDYLIEVEDYVENDSFAVILGRASKRVLFRAVRSTLGISSSMESRRGKRTDTNVASFFAIQKNS